MKRFADYEKAHAYAQVQANQIGRDVGIERSLQFGDDGFSVFILPNEGNRYGHELRCEVVRPSARFQLSCDQAAPDPPQDEPRDHGDNPAPHWTHPDGGNA